MADVDRMPGATGRSRRSTPTWLYRRQFLLRGRRGAGAPRDRRLLVARRNDYLADFAHWFGIRPWEWDGLILADVENLMPRRSTSGANRRTNQEGEQTVSEAGTPHRFRSFPDLAKAVRAAEPQLRTGLLAGLRAGEITLQRRR